ncbi:hypothetical protein [Pseudomonas grandcourensis]|uniref:hypothetical protein n=1 Tax=Pseudomonas grandcourensis TaxID=3136736 RepID=UPI003267A316
MSLLSKKALVLLLAAATGLGALSAQAAKATSSDAPAQKVSMLGSKFTFNLPKGFIANPLPASPDGASGTLYSNETTKTVVIAAENTLPNGISVKDNDGVFLDGTVADFEAAQHKSLPDYNKLSEKNLTQKAGLGLRQVDGTATQGGGMTLTTTLMAASGTRMAVIQVISRPGDMAAHETLIKQIVSGK